MSNFQKKLVKLKKSANKKSFLEFLYLAGQTEYENYSRSIKLYGDRLDSFIKFTQTGKFIESSLAEKNVKSFININFPEIEIDERNILINQLRDKTLDIDSTLELLSTLIKEISSKQTLEDLFSNNERDKIYFSHQKAITIIEQTLDSNLFENLSSRTGYSFEDLLDYTKRADYISDVITTGNSSFCGFHNKKASICVSSKWMSEEYVFKRACSLAHEIGHAFYQCNHISKLELWSDFCLYPSLTDHETAAILFELVLGGIDMTENNTGVRLTSDKINYLKHILIRCKMEELMFNEAAKGTLNGSFIKNLWLDLNYKYLSLKVEPDSIRQDMHWFNGMFGYFYSYGVAISKSITIYNKILTKLGNSIEDDIELISKEIGVSITNT